MGTVVQADRVWRRVRALYADRAGRIDIRCQHGTRGERQSADRGNIAIRDDGCIDIESKLAAIGSDWATASAIQ